MEIKQKRYGFNQKKRNRLLFYIAGVSLPVLQFCVFYIYLNASSFALAFQKYSTQEGKLGYIVTFAGFENFKVAFQALKNYSYMLKNSLVYFVFHVGIGMTLAVVFSFYIYKKFRGAGAFKTILFLPKIVPGVVFSLLFKYLVTDCYSAIATAIKGEYVFGLLDNPETLFPTVVAYNIWIGFGVNVLLYSGSMSNINESLVESAQLDGANIIQEFFHITIPMIWPTFTTFVVVAVSGIFTNGMALYSLFQTDAIHIGTLGYYFYISALKSGVEAKGGYLSYPELSALGMILTAVMCPLTLLVRKLMRKFGPSVE